MSAASSKSGVLGSALLGGGLVLVLLGERVLGESATLGTVPGLIAIAAAIALRAVTFVRSTGDARAVEARLLAAYSATLTALGLYGLTTTSGIGLLESIFGVGGDAARAHVVSVLTVAWMAIVLLALSAVLFIELTYQGMPIPAAVELRRVRQSLHAGLSLALATIFALSMGYVATERDVRKDVSYFKTASPSGATQAMIGKLDQPLRVMMLYRPGSDVLAALQPYFDALKGTGKLDIEARDIALAPELAQKYKIRENGAVLLLQGEGEAQKGQVMQVGEELTGARRTLRRLDAAFQESFAKLVRPTRGLAITVGHGERNAKSSEVDPGDATAVMTELLKRLNLKAENVGMSQGLGRAVPSLSTAVLIVGPTEKFLPEEAESLVAYLKKGGRIFMMIDPNVDVGLGPVLDAIGLIMLPGTLTSETHHMVGRHNDSDKSVVYSNTYSAHPSVTTLMRNQREVASVFYKGGALFKAEGDRELKPQVSYPVRTAGTSFRDLNDNYAMDPGEQKEILMPVAAVSLQGEDGNEGRAIVIADGDFITDKLAQNKGNYLLFVDAIAWLVGNEELPAEVSSEEDVPIEHSRDDDKLWFYATTFAVPVPVALLGVFVSRRRRKASNDSRKQSGDAVGGGVDKSQTGAKS
jgi:hypothetical protein